MNDFSAWMLRNNRRIEWAFIALFAALLVYSIADALALMPGERGWRPRASVVMGVGLLLQPTAALVGRRSRPLQIALLVLSIALCMGSLRIAS